MKIPLKKVAIELNQKIVNKKRLGKISLKKDEYLTKKNNLKKLNYQNTWNNVNQNLLKIFNEN